MTASLSAYITEFQPKLAVTTSIPLPINHNSLEPQLTGATFNELHNLVVTTLELMSRMLDLTPAAAFHTSHPPAGTNSTAPPPIAAGQLHGAVLAPHNAQHHGRNTALAPVVTPRPIDGRFNTARSRRQIPPCRRPRPPYGPTIMRICDFLFRRSRNPAQPRQQARRSHTPARPPQSHVHCTTATLTTMA